MGLVGASLDNLTTVTNVATATGTAASDTGSAVTRQAEALRQEVQDTVDVLKTDFQTTNDDLIQIVDQTNTELQATGWVGTSREEAMAASEEFKAELARIGASALEQIEAFRTAAIADADAINQAIGVELNRVLAQLNTTLATFGTEVQRYSTALSNIDTTTVRRVPV